MERRKNLFVNGVGKRENWWTIEEMVFSQEKIIKKRINDNRKLDICFQSGRAVNGKNRGRQNSEFWTIKRY